VRTTLTLDPDIAAKLRALARERGVPFKDVVNGVLRLGLARGDAAPAPRYRVPSKPLGLRPGYDLDQALRLAGQLEDAELIRKLEQRK
jgi:hypothetical protein